MKEIIELLETELKDVGNYAKKTVANYRSCIENFFEFINSQFSIHPSEVKGTHLKEWMKHLKQTGISNSRLIHHKSALKHCYSLMLHMNYIDKNPALSLFHIRKVKSELNQPITADTAFQLLNAIDRSSWLGERDYMIISILWALGLRRQEATTLTVADFDFNFDPSNKIGFLRVHGKDRKERALFVACQLYDNLVNYLMHPKSPTEKDQPLFPAKLGTFLKGDAIGKIIRKTVKKSGIQVRITAHVLRHSFATEMYLQKVPAEDIQAMMGHDKIEETSGYIHIPMKLKKEALQKITISGETNGC